MYGNVRGMSQYQPRMSFNQGGMYNRGMAYSR